MTDATRSGWFTLMRGRGAAVVVIGIDIEFASWSSEEGSIRAAIEAASQIQEVTQSGGGTFSLITLWPPGTFFRQEPRTHLICAKSASACCVISPCRAINESSC